MKRKLDDYEAETYFSRQEDSLPEAGGRFAAENRTRLITGGASYPMPPSDYPLAQHEPQYLDVVDEPTSMTFGQDLTRLPGAPPKPANGPQLSKGDFDEQCQTED